MRTLGTAMMASGLALTALTAYSAYLYFTDVEFFIATDDGSGDGPMLLGLALVIGLGVALWGTMIRNNHAPGQRTKTPRRWRNLD